MSIKNKVDEPKNITRYDKDTFKENGEFFEENTIGKDDYCIINDSKIEGNACSTIRNKSGKDV